MSDNKDPLMDLDEYIQQQKLKRVLKDLDDVIPPESETKAPPPVKKAKAKTPRPMVRWVEKDQDGNVIYSRPRSSRRKRSNQGEHCCCI